MMAELVAQSGHGGRIESVAFAPDGRTLATLGWEGALKLWDARTGDLTRSWAASSQPPLLFSPDGRFLVTAWNSKVQFWEVKSGALAAQMFVRLRKATHGELRTAFSPDGEWLAVGGWNETLVWKFADCLAQFEASLGRLPELFYFPPGYKTLPYVGNALSLQFLPDCRTLIVGRGDYGSHFDGTFGWSDGPAGEGKLDLWDVPTETLQTTLTEEFLWPNCMALSSNGRLLAVPNRGSYASRGGPGTVALGAWDGGTWLLSLAGTAEEEQPPYSRLLRGHRSSVTCLAFAPHSKMLASGSRDQSICLWDTERAALVRALTGHTHEINTVAFAPDGRMLASGGWDNAVIIWNAQTGETIRTQTGDGFAVSGFAFAPNGQHFAVAIPVRGKPPYQSEKHLRLHGWNLQTGQHWPEKLHDWRCDPNHGIGEFDMLFSPDSDHLAMIGAERLQPLVALWQPDRDTEPTELSELEKPMRFTFSPDSQNLIGTNGRTTCVWDAATGARLKTVDVEQDARTGQPLPAAYALSPDGRTALCGQVTSSPPRCKLALADVQTGTTLHELGEREGYINGVRFAANGERVFIKTNFEPITAWDARTGRRLGIFEDVALPMPACSPDGRWIAGRTEKQTIGLWDVETFARRADIAFEKTPFDAYMFTWSADSKVLAGRGVHSSVYFWQADGGRLLGTLTFLPNGVDWIVTTPEGEYEVSEGAAPFLRWREGEQMLPFAAFATGKYQTGLLQRVTNEP